MIFGKFYLDVQKFFKVFKITRFSVILIKIKIKFKVKTVLSSITTLERYLKASLNLKKN